MIPRFLLLILLCLPALAQRRTNTAAKDDKADGGAPAVNAQEVKVIRGKSVVIELTGTTRTNKAMTFIIRDQPKLGRFTEEKPKPSGDRSAKITYTSATDGKGAKDKFTFAAQVPGSSVCEPATVTITITDPAVRLDTIEVVEARRLVLGSPGERTFLMRNGGTAKWEAKVPAPKGWQWIAPAGGAFSLAPGAEINARISCLAVTVGALEEIVSFDADTKITFRAQIVPPFSLTAPAALVWQKETRTRTGSIELTNLDPVKPLTIQVTAPAWLKTEQEVTLAPDVKAVLHLAVDTDHGKDLTGQLKLTAGTHSESVEIKAAPSPALLTVTGGLDEHYGLHFGRLTAGSLIKAKRPFVVLNEGGAPATVTLKVPEHFTLEPPLAAEGKPLAPGAEVTFTLLPPKQTAGTFKAELLIEGGDDIVTIECSAGIDPSAIPPLPGKLAGIRLEQSRPKGAVRIRTAEDQKRNVMVNFYGAYFGDGTEDEKMPRIDVVEIAADTGEEVTFAWDLPEGDGWKFQLLRAAYRRLANGDPGKVWDPCGDEVKYTVEGRRATATVSELPPHMPFNFCIQTIAADGRHSFPGKPISYRPFPPDPSHWQEYRAFYGGAAALLIALGWWLRKKWLQPLSASA